MRHAAETLRNTDKSISEIAAASGYENQGKFGGIFKRIYGMTPMEYRRQNKCEKTKQSK
jgi:AraC-like DNA-binding protein